jgi:hypothetical protein
VKFARLRRPKAAWNIDLTQIQQHYKKQVSLRGGHIRQREGKRKKIIK